MVAPTGLTLTAAVEALTASWGVSETEGLAGFDVRYRPVTSPASPWGAQHQLPASARSYTIPGLTAGTTYEVEVKALTTGGTVEGLGTPQ